MLGRLEYYFNLIILIIFISIIIAATFYAIIDGLCINNVKYSCSVYNKIEQLAPFFIKFMKFLTLKNIFKETYISTILVLCFFFFSILGLVILIITTSRSRNVIFYITIVLLILVFFLIVTLKIVSWISRGDEIGNDKIDLKRKIIKRLQKGFREDYPGKIPRHDTCIIILIMIVCIVVGLFVKPYLDSIPLLPKLDKTVSFGITIGLCFCFIVILFFYNIGEFMNKKKNVLAGGSIKKNIRQLKRKRK